MRRTIVLLILAVLISGCVDQQSVAKELVEVSRVIDGDTIQLVDGRRVRLISINAPEENEFYYNESKDYLEQLVKGKEVELDIFGDDKYGRLLAHVYIDNTLINLEIVKNGFAHTYFVSPDEKFYLEFKKAEKEAQEEKVGIWKSLLQGCISIVDLHYDAKGNDNNNLNDEYVIFKNQCDSSVEMSKWEVKDTGTHIYMFKTFIVEPNNNFTLYSGSGTDSNNNLYWNSNGAIWNNDKDTLFIRDAAGNLVLTYSYPS